jgi:hypothetical protein
LILVSFNNALSTAQVIQHQTVLNSEPLKYEGVLATQLQHSVLHIYVMSLDSSLSTVSRPRISLFTIMSKTV